MTVPSAPAAALAAPPAFDSTTSGLFLDFDGTLVELAERPDGVVVDEELRVLLARLSARFAGRVAIVSGRSIAQLEALIGPGVAGIATVGSHGAEIRPAGGRLAAADRPAGLAQAEAAFVAAFGQQEGVLIEVKTRGVAVHYRLAPAFETEAGRLAERLAGTHGLEVQRGKMMVELREGGHDKGSGIAALMAAAPFAGCTPLFLGDDVTDEAGFAFCARAGGAGILVGPQRDSAAGYRLDDVAAVRDWLAAL